MVTRVSTLPKAKAKPVPGPQRAAIQAVRGCPPGLPGVIRILATKANSEKQGDQFQYFGDMTDAELLTLRRCAGQAFDRLAIATKAFGQIIASYHPGPAANCSEEIGDMVTLLGELLEEARETEGRAVDDLAIRGFNFDGELLGEGK